MVALLKRIALVVAALLFFAALLGAKVGGFGPVDCTALGGLILAVVALL